MARLKQRQGEAGLREYLLEEAVALRRMYGSEFWDALSAPVDCLIGGEAYTLRRYQLPDGHPLRLVGCPAGMSDVLVLTEDDRLLSG
ncbi:hypothetical protein [Mycobacterium marinum]|uniref:hypothetical protein n=1 Tax=Mycobacterium marinum TaxID=1781 RepID=UPI00356A495C